MTFGLGYLLVRAGEADETVLNNHHGIWTRELTSRALFDVGGSRGYFSRVSEVAAPLEISSQPTTPPCECGISQLFK